MIPRLLNEYAADLMAALDDDDPGLAHARVLLTANSLRNLAASLRDEAPQPVSRGAFVSSGCQDCWAA